MKPAALSIVVTLLLAWWQAGAQSQGNTGDVAPTLTVNQPTRIERAADQLLIGSGDLLELTVFDTPELSQKLRVDNAGDVTLSLGTRVRVARLTPEQASRAIEAELVSGQVMRDPHASILVLEYATQGATILGEVRSPGIYPLTGKRTLLDLVGAAGGFLPTASSIATITRADGTEETVHLDSASDVTQGKRMNPAVQPGDRVLVRRGALVYVLGDVGKPGGYVTADTKPLTALQAIALAQGMNKTAQMKATLIQDTPNGRTQAVLDLKRIISGESSDPVTRDGDILFIPTSGAKEWTNKGITSILQMAVGVVVYGVF